MHNLNMYSLVRIMITMSEIAKLAHVSQPTVSRVLNGSANVSAEIRERVLACAREHDYQLNALAKGLQGSRTHLLGVLVADISNSFFADVAKEIEAQARRRGYSILLLNSGGGPQRERECLDVVRRYRVDGILMAPAGGTSGAWRTYAAKLDVPVVAVAGPAEGVDSICTDHAAAGAIVAKHLVERGFRRFLFVGEDCDSKYTGFRKALADIGMGDKVEQVSFESDSQLSAALDTWFRRPSFRTGIFAGSDTYALRVLCILHSLGVPVPRRAGVAGFDDTFMGRYLNPALSSVSQPIAQMAEQAVSRLLYRIDHPEERKVLELALPAELVAREST